MFLLGFEINLSLKHSSFHHLLFLFPFNQISKVAQSYFSLGQFLCK